MENDKKRKKLSSPLPPPPWLDLPDYIIEPILERLLLSDYVRFAAVCTKFQSIQKSHRLRYSPHPPPIRRLPWIFSHLIIYNDEDSMHSSSILTYYSPFEQKLYSLKPNIRLCEPHFVINFTSSGWMLLYSWAMHRHLSLFHPISNAHFPIPDEDVSGTVHFSPLSSLLTPSLSLPPNWSMLGIDHSSTRFFLFRLGQYEWTRLHLPPNFRSLGTSTISPVFSRGKFYCFTDGNLLVVDDSTSTVDYLEMDGLHILPEWKERHLVEASNGEVVFVGGVVNMNDDDQNNEIVEGFKLFKADIARRVWVKMDNIGGDRVLLLDEFSCSYSVLASDVGIPAGNCILYLRSKVKILDDKRCVLWKTFDIGTGRLLQDVMLSEEEADQFMSCGERRLLWFVPSLC